MVDPSTVATIALAGVGAIGTVAGWAVRTYVRGEVSPVQQQLTTHEATDELIHTYVKESLDDLKATTAKMDEKIDRLLDRA